MIEPSPQKTWAVKPPNSIIPKSEFLLRFGGFPHFSPPFGSSQPAVNLVIPIYNPGHSSAVWSKSFASED